MRKFLAHCFAVLALAGAAIFADVKLPSIIGDGMVLQRDVPLKVWGWADPGETVRVKFRELEAEATTGADGRWTIHLAPLAAGGPDRMEIIGDNELTITDVLVGDVWLCSGQSNMTHQFNRWQERYAEEIAAAEIPEIRQFYVPTTPVLTGPSEDLPGLEWKRATSANVLDFTVVGYFFAKKLYDRYEVPQGIIMSCVGGTRIEAWTSEEGFAEFPDQLARIERNKDAAYVDRINAEAKSARERLDPGTPPDAGLTGVLEWFDPDYEPRNWKRINVPGFWEDQGIRDLDGVVWYRREIDLPESMTGAEAQVKLGRIVDADALYVNGELVGETGYQYPQRRYTIPPGVLKAGRNLLVVRVTNYHGKGGFVPDKPYRLEVGEGHIDLKGDWFYRVGSVFPPRPLIPEGINPQNEPASLFHGMIAPFTNYGIRGILWYQGESNAWDPESYYKLLPNLIADWRAHWRLGDLPFLIAQLPNFMEVDYLPTESNWALMREAQLETARRIRKTGLGINIDLGEWNDIHPGNKKPVGERLALQAMKISYGEEDLVASGPVFRSQEIQEGRILLTFDNVGSGLVSRDGEPLAHFAIAGVDKVFHWAQAEIQGDQVVVWSDQVPAPLYVRYAWADNPDFANLGNEEGLPASPFRTDR